MDDDSKYLEPFVRVETMDDSSDFAIIHFNTIMAGFVAAVENGENKILALTTPEGGQAWIQSGLITEVWVYNSDYRKNYIARKRAVNRQCEGFEEEMMSWEEREGEKYGG